MKQMLLTSSGFDNEKIRDKFIELLNKPMEVAKVLFIPTASLRKNNVLYINACLDEIQAAGFKKENIDTYRMDHALNDKSILNYDAIYVAGGETSYLFEQMQAVNFKGELDLFFSTEKAGVYIGVSAGSIALTRGYLNYFDFELKVHCDDDFPYGQMDLEKTLTVSLSDNQCVLMQGESISIFG